MPKVKLYLKNKGVDLAWTRPPGENPGKLLGKPAKDLVPSKRPSASISPTQLEPVRKLVQWATRRRRSNTSLDEAPTPTHGRQHALSPTATIPADMNLSIPPHLQPPPGPRPPHPASVACQPISIQVPDASLRAAMQQTERLGRLQAALPRPRTSTGGGGRAAARDPRITSPPTSSASAAARAALGVPPRSPNTATLGVSPFAPNSAAEGIAAEARQAAGGPELTAPQSRVRVDGLMQTLAQALVDDRTAQENFQMQQLADLQARLVKASSA